jgi:hypothetical protein
MKSIQQLNEERESLARTNALNNHLIGMSKLVNIQLRNAAEKRVYIDGEFTGLVNADQRMAKIKELMTASEYYPNESRVLELEREVAENNARIEAITTEIQYTGGSY